ncbi:ribosome maturation factor RimP [Mycobacterium sp. ACS4331]|uniref:ribosome maturation factor RimP n=1 Tax=Mycobacterium sp. ACS4331 TaxID=1834121 RepID=UPI0007FD0AA3|nr:ribosome maturation factor RimP [Mycobacterium sp. ACS4331]OBF22586.1 ribosome maturation factor RimP [Mycobacterium sp. ACS4331]
MPAGLPAPSQVIELLSAEFERAGYEIEGVVVDGHRRPPQIIVTADGDVPLDLDTIADLSRSAAQLLDEVPGLDAAYVLEVTSPGVDRPLTDEKHYRRAQGRLVELDLADGGRASGRIVGVADGVLHLVIRAGRDWAVHRIPLTDIAKAVVQVDFSGPSRQEQEFLDQTRREAGL